MEIAIDKMMMEDMVREIEISEKTTWISDPISIGSGDYFLEVKSDGHEVSIKITQTNLKGSERQRVMCLITMDAHTRDILGKLIKEVSVDKNDFQWQSQLKHRFIEKEEAGLVVALTEIHVCDARAD